MARSHVTDEKLTRLSAEQPFALYTPVGIMSYNLKYTTLALKHTGATFFLSRLKQLKITELPNLFGSTLSSYITDSSKGASQGATHN